LNHQTPSELVKGDDEHIPVDQQGVNEVADAVAASARNPAAVIVAIDGSVSFKCDAGPYAHGTVFNGECLANALRTRLHHNFRVSEWHSCNPKSDGRVVISGLRWTPIANEYVNLGRGCDLWDEQAFRVAFQDSMAPPVWFSIYVAHQAPKACGVRVLDKMVQHALQEQPPPGKTYAGQVAPLFVGDFNTGVGSTDEGRPDPMLYYFQNYLSWLDDGPQRDGGPEGLVCPAKDTRPEVRFELQDDIMHVFSGNKGGTQNFACATSEFVPVSVGYTATPDGGAKCSKSGLEVKDVRHNIVALGLAIRPKGGSPRRCPSNTICRAGQCDPAPEVSAQVPAKKTCSDDCESYAGLCYQRCSEGFHALGTVCYANCPQGMIDDGASCRAPISSITKKSQPRGAGQPMICKPGEEQNGALCYAACRAGFTGAGPVCWKPCPEGFHDDGATCRKDAVIRAKTSYGRGAGGPLTCAPGEQQDGGLCYQACRDGFRGVGPVCWGTCPSGYHDDGATCRRDAHVVGADNSKCPWYDKCGVAGARGCSKCPDGYHNDGCTCRVDANVFGKPSYGRGAGRPLSSCAATSDKSGALCYPHCQAGYTGAGPVCWSSCPGGFHDDGATCRMDAQILQKESYGRGAGSALSACRPGQEKNGALCYGACPANMSGAGPVCWDNCPTGYRDDGAVCTKGGNVIAAPGSYPRMAGTVPP
jgi:hypothetical protein